MNTNAHQESIFLDSDFLYSIYDGDTDHAVVIFEQFLSTYAAQLADIQTSHEAGDVLEFRRKMHKVKPIFSFVGATALTNKAEIIEKKCLEISSLESIENLYILFLAELDLYLPIIKREYQKLSTVS